MVGRGTPRAAQPQPAHRQHRRLGAGIGLGTAPRSRRMDRDPRASPSVADRHAKAAQASRRCRAEQRDLKRRSTRSEPSPTTTSKLHRQPQSTSAPSRSTTSFASAPPSASPSPSSASRAKTPGAPPPAFASHFFPALPKAAASSTTETEGWWSDADVRWLTGLHESAEGWYFNKESHQQMVWWSTLPELVKIQIDPVAEKQRLNKLAKAIDAELLEAERVHYRLHRAKPEARTTASEVVRTDTAPRHFSRESKIVQHSTKDEATVAEDESNVGLRDRPLRPRKNDLAWLRWKPWLQLPGSRKTRCRLGE